MDALGRWIKHSSPIVKMLMAISITSFVYVGNKLWYAPYARRQRHKQAEEWANIIIEKEELMEEQNKKY